MRKQVRRLRLVKETVLNLAAVDGGSLNGLGSSGCGATSCCTSSASPVWCSERCAEPTASE